jgi:Tol biopolymer transport system component
VVAVRRLIALATIVGLTLLGVANNASVAGASVYPGANGKIVFNEFSGDSVDSFTVDPDGSNLTQIGPAGTTYCGDNNEPWSPNGSKVVCIVFKPNGTIQTATVGPAGSGYMVLSNPKLPPDFGCGSWSPDGTRLLCPFTSGGVYTVRPNGTGLLELTTTPTGEGPSGYANDGSHAYFTTQDQNDFRTLYSVKTDGTGGLTALSPPTVSVLDQGSFDGVSADSSPDGSQVVFAAVVSGATRALYVVNIDGTGLRQIKTPTGINPTSAQWSPDGNWIAFSGRPPTFSAFVEVYLIHPDGSGLREVTLPTSGCSGFTPIWSPDGTKLLFVSACKSGTTTSYALDTTNLDGSGLSEVIGLNGRTSYGWGTASTG